MPPSATKTGNRSPDGTSTPTTTPAPRHQPPASATPQPWPRDSPRTTSCPCPTTVATCHIPMPSAPTGRKLTQRVRCPGIQMVRSSFNDVTLKEIHFRRLYYLISFVCCCKGILTVLNLINVQKMYLREVNKWHFVRQMCRKIQISMTSQEVRGHRHDHSVTSFLEITLTTKKSILKKRLLTNI